MSKRPAQPKPWMPFALPAAFAALIVAAFLLGGPPAGFAVAVVLALAVVYAAIRLGAPRRSSPGGRRWLADAARRLLIPLAIAVAGVILVVATTDTAHIVGWGLIGVAVSVALSLVFLEVGYSEDRARARGDETPDAGSERRPDRRSRPAPHERATSHDGR